jgi:hypothetical protein
MRPETGPMQFDQDWTGVFIRGDDAKAFATALQQIRGETGPNSLRREFLGELLNLLESPVDGPGIQYLKAFPECVNRL